MSTPTRTTPHTSSRAAVLDVIRAAGTISRVSLVNATGLTGATISTVVRGLIDDDLVRESGRAESTGGKRRVLLQLNPSARYAVGIHLDHADITYVVTDLAGAVVARISRPGAGNAAPEAVVKRMTEEATALVASAAVDRERLLGFGLVFPGPLSANDGMAITPPAMRQWADFPLGAEMRRATGLPVVLDNDATAAALGEHWSGGVDLPATFAALYMGSGIGAGLIVNGISYRGASGNTGEVGHICLDLDGPECWCGARGCLEILAGPAAVVAAARADRRLARAAGLSRRDHSADQSVIPDFAAVSRAARRGDEARSPCWSARLATSPSRCGTWRTSRTSKPWCSPDPASPSPDRATCRRSNGNCTARSSPAPTTASKCGCPGRRRRRRRSAPPRWCCSPSSCRCTAACGYRRTSSRPNPRCHPPPDTARPATRPPANDAHTGSTVISAA